jgi:hypothetical protein
MEKKKKNHLNSLITSCVPILHCRTFFYVKNDVQAAQMRFKKGKNL